MTQSRLGLLVGFGLLLVVSSAEALNHVLGLSRPGSVQGFVETLLTDKTVRTEPTLPTYPAAGGKYTDAVFAASRIIGPLGRTIRASQKQTSAWTASS